MRFSNKGTAEVKQERADNTKRAVILTMVAKKNGVSKTQKKES
jgi:hypothetical protein